MAYAISNNEDVIDSRDVIARIEELEREREVFIADAEEASLDDPNAGERASIEWGDTDEAGELAALKALAEEAEGYGDWRYGESLIRDSYFETYAQELADDIGAIDRSASWPLNCIDWEKAACELQMDYTSVDFDGVTYWIRS